MHQSPTLDLNLLRAFIAVYDTASFTLAAARLGGPRSTVSRSIATLEEALGVRLFHRTTRNVSATSAGVDFHARVAPALAELEATLSSLPEQEELPSGTLRITTTADLAAAVLADAVTRFTARYPAVRVELHLTSAVVDLVKDGFDMALRISQKALRDSSLHAKKVGEIRIGLYAAPAYLARRGTPRSNDELAGHEQVAFQGVPLMERRKNELPAQGGRIVCDDMFFSREVLKAGAGIGVLPSFLADPEIAAGNLVRVLPKWSPFTGAVYLIHPGGRHVPKKVSAFRELVIETLRQRPLADP